MADTPESGVKKEIKAVLNAASAYFYMPSTGGYGKSGALDFSVCHHGYAIGVEAKSIYSPYGKQGPTLLQQEHIKAIFASGGIALVINETNYELLKEVLHDCATGQHDRARNRALRAYGESTPRTPAALPESPDEPAPVLRRKR